MIGWIAAGIAALVAGLTLVRLFLGPTLQDRALAALGSTVHASLICAALGLAFGVSQFADVAFGLLVSALLCAAAVLKFFRARSFQPSLAPARED